MSFVGLQKETLNNEKPSVVAHVCKAFGGQVRGTVSEGQTGLQCGQEYPGKQPVLIAPTDGSI